MNKNKEIEEMAKELTAYEWKLCERLPKNKCLLTSAIHAQVSCDYCKIAEFLINEGYRNCKDKVVIPEKITEETSPEDIIKIAKYNEKVRKETAREILKSFEYCNDQTFYEQWLKLAKEYEVGVE
jgi:hypothetical protein